MKSIYSEMISQQKNPSSETLKAKASEVISKFDEYQKLLSDKGAWEKMKRKERKDKLESMNSEIDGIIQKPISSRGRDAHPCRQKQAIGSEKGSPFYIQI
jgi:hypothetical protein